jgi:hypothetical protein
MRLHYCRYQSPVSEPSTGVDALSDRQKLRKDHRFPISVTLSYRLLSDGNVAEAEEGRSLDISRSGISFTTAAPIRAGRRVELSLWWPALLNGSTGLKLMIYGNVVRSTLLTAVVRIEQYEFRTAGSNSRFLCSEDQPPEGPQTSC